MKPIRQAELNHYNETINSKFYQKARDIETEINSQAQELSDKKEKSFTKELKVEAKLKIAQDKYLKYKKFMEDKDKIERELMAGVRNACEVVENHLNNVNNARGWNLSFDGYDVRDEDPVHYFKMKIDKARFTEAFCFCNKNHKIKNILEAKKEYAKNILYSGGDINTVATELRNAFLEANIEFALPKSLLRISA
tara:strand:- start:677 stop:1261 length:585 start_codon:yes stop_codon:yes gene_type:complete